MAEYINPENPKIANGGLNVDSKVYPQPKARSSNERCVTIHSLENLLAVEAKERKIPSEYQLLYIQKMGKINERAENKRRCLDFL